ncbi:MAG: IS5 family transposase [Burkholderiaceae bacterium]|nr:MAG: IS5 family transposase [Burkholderiaceae bacterium]QLP99100.1 MAG: IS5 family transposase [Burkholderiaceae bacterium]QLP99621.1 MAG: IS5 family transposase [Burkholderiaceae bacterium]QLP99930.1 MAG: IS5 family transposase [Burkholderiaceae bacterium]QLQ00508.1 MAG: IS5 family transposase [Burkholderiaceae bacterium]
MEQVQRQRSGRRPGRKPLIGPEHHAVLVEIATQMPRCSLDELTREFNHRSALSVCSATVRKALREAGVKRVRAQRKSAERAASGSGARSRVGYQALHRRADGTSGMNTDLTDAEWALLADLFERQGGRGAPPRHERRLLLNACLYVVRTGCAWRLLPKEVFPPWRAVYKAFRGWAHSGVFEAMHDRLRQQWRARMGRSPMPTAAIIDAQSTRSTPQGGPSGFDAGKKVKGRKRHLVVDTLGLLLAVSVTAASVQDRDAAAAVVAAASAKAPTLQTLYADAAYGGRSAQAIELTHGIAVHIVRHPGNRSTGTWQTAQQPLWPEEAPAGFVVQAKRWVVERTHAWNERSRRLLAHHDRSTWAPVAWIWLTEARILATRLAQRFI